MTVKISPAIELRPLVVGDAPALFNVIERNRTRLKASLYWVNNVNNVAETEHYIKQRAESQLPHSRWFTVYFNQELNGVFAIKYVNANTKTAEVGYWLAQNALGCGVINTVVDYFKVELINSNLADFIEFRCLDQNKASIRVAEKAGAILQEVKDYQGDNEFSLQKLLIYRTAFSS